MAVTTDPFDATELVAVIPEVWTPMVNEAFFAKTVLANFCTDLSAMAASGGDIFHVPDLYTNVHTAQTQSTQAAEVTTAAPATVDVTLTIDTHKYVAIAIGDADMTAIAAQYDMMNEYTRQAASVLADELEDSLAALWSSITTNTVGDTATVLSDAEVRQSIEKLDTTNYDLTECAFFVHPYVYWNQLHAIAKYYDQSIKGPANEAGMVVTGNFRSPAMERALRGFLYGIPVFTTSNVVSGLQTYRNLLLHKSCLGFALQTKGGGKIRVQADNLVQNLAALVVVDINYGVAVLREPGGVLMNASSAFLGS